MAKKSGTTVPNAQRSAHRGEYYLHERGAVK
jgi:hypothetical protein